MKKISYITVGIYILFLLTGCSPKSSEAKLVPYHDKVTTENFYVIHQHYDKRNLENTISQVLQSKGYKASSGTVDKLPEDVNIVVTYEDRWYWDMSPYMIQLNIEFRNAENHYPIVAGETIRTSLSRKSPKNMIIETIDVMLNKLNGEK